MSKPHYFQRYHQKENVVTNNTLLLLSRLYARSPLYLETFLNDLVETGTVEIGVTFTQQDARAELSVPDATLVQPSLKVIVETKLHSRADVDQLKRHLSAFDDEEAQILLLVTPKEPSPDLQRELDRAVRDYNERHQAGVVHACTTFDRIIRSYESTLADHDYEMHELLADYKDFCLGEGLLPQDEYWMRAVPCGKTLDDNFEFGVYYQPVDRGWWYHRYIGIYKDKRIQGIGEIEDIVAAELAEGGLQVEGDASVTPEQRRRIEGVVRRAEKRHGWDITTGTRFFLVKRFCPTDFRRTSPGGMRGAQYFDLGKILDTERLPSVEGIAIALSEKTW